MRFGKVKIKSSFLIIFIANLLTNNFLEFFALLIAFFIHELGHLLVVYLKKGKVLKLEISALGGVLTTNIDSFLVDFGRSYFKLFSYCTV